MKIRDAFSSEPVNQGRQIELDLLKGFAIVFMVWVHVIGCLYCKHSVGYSIVDDILGSPYAAPMFMIALGMGVCFSQRKSAARLAFRALAIFAIGTALNAVRYVLPYFFACQARGYPYTVERMFIDLFSVDILQFASLAFLFLAFARWRRWSLGKLALFGVQCSLLAWMLRWQSTGNVYADVICGWLWGTGDSTCFPFLGWIIFPIAGVCIGHALMHCRDKHSVYLRISPICLLVGTGYVWYAYATQSLYLSESSVYFFLTTVDAFFIILLAIGLLGQNALLVRLCRGWKFPFLTRLSRNINAIYCIHWTIVMAFSMLCLFWWPGYQFTFAQCTVMTAILLLISDALASFYASRIRPVLHAASFATRKHPMWQPVFRLFHTTVPNAISRSFRALNALLFAGGVALTAQDKTKQ